MRFDFEHLPLSYAQQRQWFLWQLEPGSAAYHIPAALRLKGSLDLEALQHSFATLIARHETLRTTFRQEGEQAIQVIHPIQRFELEQAVLEGADEQDIRACVEAEIQRPFDLERGPLLRVKLLRLSEEDHVLVLTLHHIVSDGWSTPIMVDELVQLYAGYREGRELSLPELPIQYADYALWQRSWMEAGERERQLAYWQEQLGGEQPVLELPTDRARPAVQSHAGASLNVELESALSHSLKRLAQEQGTTLFMVLLASFQALLHRYSGQGDIRVGVPIANRTRVETEGLIGFFVNTQVLKAELDLTTSFSDLLRQVKGRALGAQGHQDLPFEQLVEALQPERSLSHSPLFQVMYNHQSEVKGEARELPGLRVESLEWESHNAQFDLTLSTFESDTGLWASLNYAVDLFDEQTMERLGRHWKHLLEGICANPEQRVAELPLLGAEERHQILRDWNRTEASYPSEQCVHELIEAQVERSPDGVALVFGDRSLTYGELNRRANRLAHRLREQGVGPDVLVGIAVERSLEMVVGLLGVLKAGGAYVPLDPEYPEDRLAYMVEDSGIELLLTQREVVERLPSLEGLQSVCLEGGEDWLEGYSEANLDHGAGPENLAYVIYTSGSTGRPKGALLPHHNVLRLFRATASWFQFNDQDVWTLFHSYAFDFSVWEIFGALLHGGRLVIVPRDTTRSPEALHALLIQEQVSVLNQTPSAFKQLMHVACESKRELALRYVIFGGEALEVRSLAPWFECFGDKSPQLVNMYGITETTVHVTHRRLELEDLRKDVSSPIGAVIPDMSWYVLDGECNPVARGSSGELYVGQAGLARGYHARPGLTAERFVPDPFDEHGGGRLYRTGDLARYRTDGVIEYVGRIDHQVKVRGFRIELGEIEARLLEQVGVREAVVLAQEGASGKQLVGYVVPAEAEVMESHEAQSAQREVLRAALRASLPEYMVPAHLLFLECLPLTPNGKLDRKALPQPDASLLQSSYVAPRTELEQQIATIWAQVLKVERVGLDDNFFELGGHSLLLLIIKEKIKKVCDKELAINTLMLNATVRSLASNLEGREQRSLLVKLNGQDKGSPLFLLHPSFGSVHCYKALALALRNELPVFGVVCRALIEKGAGVPTWEEMVDEYVAQILSVQEHGRYYLAGWSLGGNLAMDIAYKLESLGRRVDFLGWIDAPPPFSVSEFWNDSNASQDIPQMSDSIYTLRVNLLCAIFPASARIIADSWSEICSEVGDAQEQWDRFYARAERDLGYEFERVCEELISGREVQESWELKRALDLSMKDTSYKAVDVPVSCWWAARSKTARERELIEASMRTVLNRELMSSSVIDAAHDGIVDNADFIQSFVSALKACRIKVLGKVI